MDGRGSSGQLVNIVLHLMIYFILGRDGRLRCVKVTGCPFSVRMYDKTIGGRVGAVLCKECGGRLGTTRTRYYGQTGNCFISPLGGLFLKLTI